MASVGYPLSVSYGSLELTDDYPTIVKQAILSALQTELEERSYVPEYGLPRSEFESVSSIVSMMAICRQAISEGLEGYSGVTYDLRGSIGDSGLLTLLVSYQVLETTGRLEVLI